jgi:hypothetical protein
MDPLSLLIRSFSISIYPLFNYGVRAAFDTIYAVDPLGAAAATEPIFTFLKKTVLSVAQSLYEQSVVCGALFLFVLGLNLVESGSGANTSARSAHSSASSPGSLCSGVR